MLGSPSASLSLTTLNREISREREREEVQGPKDAHKRRATVLLNFIGRKQIMTLKHRRQWH